MQRDLTVKSKGVTGKNETPFVVLKGDAGTKLKLMLTDKSQLDEFGIDECFTVKIVVEQQKLEAETEVET